MIILSVFQKCSTLFFHLYNIKKISKYLSKQCKEPLIHALVRGRLDYCNSLLYGSPAYLVKKMHRVQNSAARLIFQVSKFNTSRHSLVLYNGCR